MALVYEKVSRGIVNDTYYQVRRLQAQISKYPEFKPGELISLTNNRAIVDQSRKFATLYFQKFSDIDMFEEVMTMYKIFLILSPIYNTFRSGFPAGMKMDWGRGHVLYWIRSRCNNRVRRFYFREWKEDRDRKNDERISLNMRLMGICDEHFISFCTECFRRHYGDVNHRQGKLTKREERQGIVKIRKIAYVRNKLANSIFDPIYFYGRGRGNHIRVGNFFYRLEPYKFPGAIDLRKESGTIWDYEVRYRRVMRVDGKRKGKPKLKEAGEVNIIMSRAWVKQFKGEVESVLRANFQSPKYKVMLLERKIRAAVEDTVFAKNIWERQLKELRDWIKQITDKISKSVPAAGSIGDIFSETHRRRTSEIASKKMFYGPRTNFYWSADTERPGEKQFMVYYSPYRENYYPETVVEQVYQPIETTVKQLQQSSGG